MRLTPVEIQHQPLGRGWRGYDRKDVDKLLEHAAASFEEVWRERDELGTRVAELEAELASFRDSERSLSESLLTVHRFADELREEAKQEAERLAEQAQSDQKRRKAEAEREIEELHADVERLQSLERNLRANLETLLHQALNLIETAPDEKPPDAAVEEIVSAERSRAADRG